MESDRDVMDIREWLEENLDFNPPRPNDVGNRVGHYSGILLMELHSMLKQHIPRLSLKFGAQGLKAKIIAAMESLGRPYYSRESPACILGAQVKSTFADVSFKVHNAHN